MSRTISGRTRRSVVIVACAFGCGVTIGTVFRAPPLGTARNGFSTTSGFGLPLPVVYAHRDGRPSRAVPFRLSVPMARPPRATAQGESDPQ